MKEQEFIDKITELSIEERDWQKQGLVQKNLLKDRDAMRSAYARWQYVLKTLDMWELTIRKHLNEIATAKWDNSEYEPAPPINTEKLRKRIYKNESQVSRIILSWKVHKNGMWWFIKRIPFYRVEVLIPYTHTDTIGDELKVFFWTTGMKACKELVDKDSFRNSLIEMYEHVPDYEDVLTRLVQVLFESTDRTIQVEIKN